MVIVCTVAFLHFLGITTQFASAFCYVFCTTFRNDSHIVGPLGSKKCISALATLVVL